ncbi:MAG: alpha/beta hydrolase family protein [Pirellula sp.]|nr:dienelactone hydrolase family protein [Pirellula sp.]
MTLRYSRRRKSQFAWASHWLTRCVVLAAIAIACPSAHTQVSLNGQYADTEPLDEMGDAAARMLEGVDRFLDKQLEQSSKASVRSWPKPQAKPTIPEKAKELYVRETKALRTILAERIGLVDVRSTDTSLVQQSAFGKDPYQFHNEAFTIYEVAWNVYPGVQASGLVVQPKEVRFCALAIPDAGQMPEELCGAQSSSVNYALGLASSGGLVVIPTVISRSESARSGRSVLTDQEYLYRSAIVLGRHVLGHEVAVVQSAVDSIKRLNPDLPIGIVGWGEGGWIALHSAAIDERIDVALVSGHFAPRNRIWQEPMHRNIHGLLPHFSDAQLAALVAPRKLVVDLSPGPEVVIQGNGAAPGRITGPTSAEALEELRRASEMLSPWDLQSSIEQVQSDVRTGQPSLTSCNRFVSLLRKATASMETVQASLNLGDWSHSMPSDIRRKEQLDMWDRHQQRILDSIHLERNRYWSKLDTSSLAKFQDTVGSYRDTFRNEIIGTWNIPKMPMRARSRLIDTKPGLISYEVEIDVYEDIIAQGILILPPNNQAEHKPCVVFQHGLEGRPMDTIVGDHPAYHDVAARLAMEGYVVFAPQNLYLMKDKFRVLQRKSNPLGKTLFSTMVAQHERIVDWLSSIPDVDPKRIAFYGLSYGGKSAMRIPALVPGYCLSICSADFNDWVWKNASTNSPYSYVWTMEYEIFEYDLGRKFNYAEMATLIAPRPFMVERGHFDGVAPDERVGLEFAKVNRLYSGLLRLPEHSRIEWFPGPHTIHGKGTFEFLAKHLKTE